MVVFSSLIAYDLAWSSVLTYYCGSPFETNYFFEFAMGTYGRFAISKAAAIIWSYNCLLIKYCLSSFFSKSSIFYWALSFPYESSFSFPLKKSKTISSLYSSLISLSAVFMIEETKVRWVSFSYFSDLIKAIIGDMPALFLTQNNSPNLDL